MPSEQSPLLQRVPVDDHRERYPHQTIKKFCTIFLVIVPVLTLAIVFFCIAIAGESDLFGDRPTEDAPLAVSSAFDSWPDSRYLSYVELQKILQSTPDPQKAREWSKYYTAGAHLCGQNLSQAEWTRDKWSEFGLPHTEITTYELYLNYPLDSRLALLEDGEVKFEATLEEDVLSEDPTTALDERIPAFHGYSASGDVTAPYVYCNYGTYQDFEELLDAGVELQGKIALVKYGGVFRGLKIKRASEVGMVGVVMYSDPGDDGEITEENGYRPYPDGPARHPMSLERGSVEYLSVAPGDPTTIGYPSKPGVPRQSLEGKIPDIPSLPVSYAEALRLLRALNGHGPNASSFPASWQTGGLAYKGVQYNTGPTPEAVQINLMNKQNYTITPAWNTIGIINGTISDEAIIIGNHRDAWIAGGAGDPNSGSSALNEVIRSFGAALARGWKPQRTLIFASWDGEEYGLLGSTEWVEEYLPWLNTSALAYLNVDVGARGQSFDAAAAPLLSDVLRDVTAQVRSPNQTVPGQTVADVWDGTINTMGSGSDFTAFQDFAGIPSLDVGFNAGPNDPVYHYHSNYDSFWWMDRYGDKSWEYHVTIAKIIALLAAKLSEETLVQLRAGEYAEGLHTYLHDARELANKSALHGSLDFSPLVEAVETFSIAAAALDARAAALRSSLSPSAHGNATAVREVNTQYKLLERAFLYEDGLDGRSWFKHVVFAPGVWTGYAGATFPGLVEAVEAGDLKAAGRWVRIVAERVRAGGEVMRGS